MKIEAFDSVWDTVSGTPKQAENIRIRVEPVTIINNWIERQGSSQAQAASTLGATQPRMPELAKGKIQIFSIDKLITMMAHAGLHVQHTEIQCPHAVQHYKYRW